jgi:hypothetical protein
MADQSCLKAYKLFKITDPMNALPRALGFESGYHGQLELHHVRHYMNFSDVEHVVQWLFENGYDVIKLDKKNVQKKA